MSGGEIFGVDSSPLCRGVSLIQCCFLVPPNWTCSSGHHHHMCVVEAPIIVSLSRPNGLSLGPITSCQTFRWHIITWPTQFHKAYMVRGSQNYLEHKRVHSPNSPEFCSPQCFEQPPLDIVWAFGPREMQGCRESFWTRAWQNNLSRSSCDEIEVEIETWEALWQFRLLSSPSGLLTIYPFFAQ